MGKVETILTLTKYDFRFGIPFSWGLDLAGTELLLNPGGPRFSSRRESTISAGGISLYGPHLPSNAINLVIMVYRKREYSLPFSRRLVSAE